MDCGSNNVLGNRVKQHIEDDSILQPDVVLQVDGELFYVNRHQLALQSPYFRALFFGCGIESNKRKIELKGVCLQHFRVLMYHSQTSILSLDRENVLGILETADFLQLEWAKLLCCKFLERELHLCNCLGMMDLAWQRGCSQLYSAARQVALTHFSAVVSQEDFLSSSKETVAHLLASDGLAIHRDDLALEAALRWVSFDKTREEHFLELMELVRPESLSLIFISKLLDTMTHSSDPRAKLICMLNEHFPTSWSMGKSLKRTREALFVLGGPHDQEQQASYKFHPLSGRWQNCTPLQRKNLTQYSVAAAGDSIVVTGGHFLDVLWFSVDWVRRYECGSQQWVDGPALQMSRHSHCSIALDSLLFVLGGSMDEGLVADVERLVLGSDGGWESVGSMSRAVERAAVAALGQCIYVACGLDENGEAFGGIQRYDTKKNHWDVVSYSPFPRYDLVATELNGAIYLFGGQALRFDVETDEWTILHEEHLEKKFFCGCTTVCGQIFLLSEKKVNKALPNMILFDPYVDNCIKVDNAIPCPVPLRGFVTIKELT
ncbi:kelch-like protein 23 [Corythoichthys intestinalis]|uniref:kelch-like protein 23 n=1 Tax=Corythoichthys intestinalis TaxID=161448 RepID=UPI0025A4D586|nr:kelch-like protein 23 [Corythoichthys intestinalis]XP_061790897.1 kelch-like protein 23 [Nerophis lumbriciformis]